MNITVLKRQRRASLAFDIQCFWGGIFWARVGVTLRVTNITRSVIATRSWLLIMATCGLVGCGSSVETKQESVPPNLHQIQVLYTIYLQRHNGQGPANAEEFKRFIRSDGATEAKRLEVDLADLDELLISPRDHQPYVINYGLRFDPQSPNQQVFVYESRGRNNRRAVAFATGWSEEVDDQRAAQLGLKMQRDE